MNLYETLDSLGCSVDGLRDIKLVRESATKDTYNISDTRGSKVNYTHMMSDHLKGHSDRGGFDIKKFNRKNDNNTGRSAVDNTLWKLTKVEKLLSKDSDFLGGMPYGGPKGYQSLSDYVDVPKILFDTFKGNSQAVYDFPYVKVYKKISSKIGSFLTSKKTKTSNKNIHNLRNYLAYRVTCEVMKRYGIPASDVDDSKLKVNTSEMSNLGEHELDKGVNHTQNTTKFFKIKNPYLRLGRAYMSYDGNASFKEYTIDIGTFASDMRDLDVSMNPRGHLSKSVHTSQTAIGKYIWGATSIKGDISDVFDGGLFTYTEYHIYKLIMDDAMDNAESILTIANPLNWSKYYKEGVKYLVASTTKQLIQRAKSEKGSEPIPLMSSIGMYSGQKCASSIAEFVVFNALNNIIDRYGVRESDGVYDFTNALKQQIKFNTNKFGMLSKYMDSGKNLMNVGGVVEEIPINIDGDTTVDPNEEEDAIKKNIKDGDIKTYTENSNIQSAFIKKLSSINESTSVKIAFTKNLVAIHEGSERGRGVASGGGIKSGFKSALRNISFDYLNRSSVLGTPGYSKYGFKNYYALDLRLKTNNLLKAWENGITAYTNIFDTMYTNDGLEKNMKMQLQRSYRNYLANQEESKSINSFMTKQGKRGNVASTYGNLAYDLEESVIGSILPHDTGASNDPPPAKNELQTTSPPEEPQEEQPEEEVNQNEIDWSQTLASLLSNPELNMIYEGLPTISMFVYTGEEEESEEESEEDATFGDAPPPVEHQKQLSIGEAVQIGEMGVEALAIKHVGRGKQSEFVNLMVDGLVSANRGNTPQGITIEEILGGEFQRKAITPGKGTFINKVKDETSEKSFNYRSWKQDTLEQLHSIIMNTFKLDPSLKSDKLEELKKTVGATPTRESIFLYMTQEEFRKFEDGGNGVSNAIKAGHDKLMGTGFGGFR